MVSDTLLLLRNYWRIDRRADTRQSRLLRGILTLILIVVAVLMSAAIGIAAGAFISNPVLPLTIRLGTMPGILLTVVLLGTLVTGINQAIRALYLTNDMELLFSAPLRSESVLSAKLLSRLPGTVLFTLLLTIPALIGFGISTGLGPTFIIAGMVALLLTPLFSLAAGALLAMLIVRVLPAKRVSEYLGAASIILGVLMAIVIQLPRLMIGSDDRLDPQAAEALSALIQNIENVPLPSMWAGYGLVDLAQGRLVSALGSLSLYLLLTAGLFIVTILAANRLYLNSWLRMQASGFTRSGYQEEAGIFGSSSVEAGIATKDWFLRLRDARQLASLASGIILAAFLAFLFLRPGSEQSMVTLREGKPENIIDMLFRPGVFFCGVILYAGWVTFNRAALTTLSIEGRSFYILKSSPLDPRTIFRGKVWGLVVPYALLSLLLLIVGWFFFRYSLVWLPYALLCLVIIGYGMLTISTAIGFRYPKLDWEDPRRMTAGNAGLASMALNVAYGLPALLVAVLPFVFSLPYARYTLIMTLAALLVMAGMAWLAERLALRTVANSWARIELPG